MDTFVDTAMIAFDALIADLHIAMMEYRASLPGLGDFLTAQALQAMVESGASAFVLAPDYHTPHMVTAMITWLDEYRTSYDDGLPRFAWKGGAR